jgi:hypothetical protein
MFSTISALGIARQHSKVSHDSNNSKSQDITKFGHFGVPMTTLNKLGFDSCKWTLALPCILLLLLLLIIIIIIIIIIIMALPCMACGLH